MHLLPNHLQPWGALCVFRGSVLLGSALPIGLTPKLLQGALVSESAVQPLPVLPKARKKPPLLSSRTLSSGGTTLRENLLMRGSLRKA